MTATADPRALILADRVTDHGCQVVERCIPVVSQISLNALRETLALAKTEVVVLLVTAFVVDWSHFATDHIVALVHTRELIVVTV